MFTKLHGRAASVMSLGAFVAYSFFLPMIAVAAPSLPTADIAYVDTEWTPDPLISGEASTYRVSIESLIGAGTYDTIQDFTVRINIYGPNALDFVSSDNAGYTCTPLNSHQLDCMVDSLAPGESLDLVSHFTVAADANENVLYCAQVLSGGNEYSDPDNSNNGRRGANDNSAERGCVGVAAEEPAPSISVDKSGPDSAVPGSEITYDVVVSNDGNMMLSDVELVDELSEFVEFVSVDPADDCVYSAIAHEVECEWNSIAVGGSETVEIVVEVSDDFEGVLPNLAVVVSDNLSDEDDHDVLVADQRERALSIQKDAPAEAVQGESITYDILVENAGGLPLTNAVMTDQLPLDVTFESVTPSDDCEYVDTDHAVVCEWSIIAVGGSEEVEITVGVDDAFEGDLVNVAEFAANDLVEEDDATTTVSAVVIDNSEYDLSVDITGDTPDPAEIGGVVMYDVEVTNETEYDSTDVELIITLDDDLTYAPEEAVAAAAVLAGSISDCSQSLVGQITCVIGDLAAGDTIQFQIPTIVADTAQDSVMVVARVQGAETEITLANNEDIETTTLLAQDTDDEPVDDDSAPVDNDEEEAIDDDSTPVAEEESVSDDAVLVDTGAAAGLQILAGLTLAAGALGVRRRLM